MQAEAEQVQLAAERWLRANPSPVPTEQPRTMTVVAHDHARALSAWGSSGFGGDRAAAREGRVDTGRLELHQLVQTEMLRAGDQDYLAALDRTLDKAHAGLIQLSSGASDGTGVAPGRVPARQVGA